MATFLANPKTPAFLIELVWLAVTASLARVVWNIYTSEQRRERTDRAMRRVLNG